jgi:hypothetical protein
MPCAPEAPPMNDPPKKRPRYQLSLLTAIVMILAANWLLLLNIYGGAITENFAWFYWGWPKSFGEYSYPAGAVPSSLGREPCFRFGGLIIELKSFILDALINLGLLVFVGVCAEYLFCRPWFRFNKMTAVVVMLMMCLLLGLNTLKRIDPKDKPLFGERFEPTRAQVQFDFDSPLTASQAEALNKRLAPTAIAQWRSPANFNLSPLTLDELEEMFGQPDSYLWTSPLGGSLGVKFPSGMSFRRRAEIMKSLFACVENVATEFAVKVGLKPIMAGNRYSGLCSKSAL